jgi:hypothetical protein
MHIELRRGYGVLLIIQLQRENNSGTILRTNHILKLIIFKPKFSLVQPKWQESKVIMYIQILKDAKFSK